MTGNIRPAVGTNSSTLLLQLISKLVYFPGIFSLKSFFTIIFFFQIFYSFPNLTVILFKPLSLALGKLHCLCPSCFNPLLPSNYFARLFHFPKRQGLECDIIHEIIGIYGWAIQIAICKMISRLQPVAHFREHLESLLSGSWPKKLYWTALSRCEG